MAGVEIAIVGGGPAGLLCGKALHKALPGRSIQVYERATKLKECGAGIFVDLNGMKALRAVDTTLFNQFQSAICEVQVKGTSNPGYHAKQWMERFDLRVGLMGWYELVQLLNDSLPKDLVQYGHMLDSVTEEGDGYRLTFADQAPVHAKMLVAADGYLSPVRQALLQDAPPEFADVIMWRARVDYREGLSLPPGPGRVSGKFAKDGQVSNMTYSLPDNKVVWVINARMAAMKQAGLEFDPEQYAKRTKKASVQHTTGARDGQAHERCQQLVRACLPELADMVAETDPSAVVEHGMYTRPGREVAAQLEFGWGNKSMTMIGDAAHSMRPTGQGMNTAWEDAVVLASHLQKGGLCPESLRAFEKERIPRVSTIATQEYVRAEASYGHKSELPMSTEEYTEFKALWEPPTL